MPLQQMLNHWFRLQPNSSHYRGKYRGIFFLFHVTFTSCLETLIGECILQERSIIDFTWQEFSVSAKKYRLVLKVMQESFHLLLLSSEFNWKVSVSSSLPPALLLFLLYFKHSIYKKEFLVPLLTTIYQAAYSSESFSCRFQTSVASRNLPYFNKELSCNPINSLPCILKNIIKAWICKVHSIFKNKFI